MLLHDKFFLGKMNNNMDSRESLESEGNSETTDYPDMTLIINKIFSSYDVREALNIKPYSVPNDHSKWQK